MGASAHDQEARRKVLVARKKEMLHEVEDIKDRLAARKLSGEDAKRELARLKTELKQVRNELNKLPKMTGAEGARGSDGPEGGGQSDANYEAVLASLARIDEDFERGRLPESTYRSLRKQYLSKGAAMMAAARAVKARPSSPFEAEKMKLLEAISALDDEFERGEIDGKVYEDLSASYRKELAEVMRRIESDEGE